MRDCGTKAYHPYLSDDLIQDNVYVNIVLDEMMCDVQGNKPLLIESDNCSSQYKCTAHFVKCQEIADLRDTTIIRIYGIPGHGKGEVDHVGGIAKVQVRRAVAAGHSLKVTEDMVDFLEEKFKENSNPTYIVKNIKPERLGAAREIDKRRTYKPITGSSKFRVCVFRPNQTMKASTRICLCELCQVEYGSCELFVEYPIVYSNGNNISLRSSFKDYIGMEEEPDAENEEEHEEEDALQLGTVVALAADVKAIEAFHLIEITAEENIAPYDEKDKWGNHVKSGQLHLRGLFFERESGSQTRYKKIKKEAFFFRESVVYAFVQIVARKKGYELTSEEFVQINSYIQNSWLCAI